MINRYAKYIFVLLVAGFNSYQLYAQDFRQLFAPAEAYFTIDTGICDKMINDSLIQYSCNKNGNLEGEYFEFFTTKENKVKGQFENGNFEGEWLFFNSPSSLEHRYIFKNNIMRYKAYYYDAKLEYEGFYNKKGKLLKILEYD